MPGEQGTGTQQTQELTNETQMMAKKQEVKHNVRINIQHEIANQLN